MNEKALWLDKAKEYLGIDEERDEATVLELARQAGTPIESSETPWCAIFVNAILSMCGIKGTGTMRARDFASWGAECEEREGAVVVYKSHVGFVPEAGKVLGGNQSDGVNVGAQSWYGTPIGYRWPIVEAPAPSDQFPPQDRIDALDARLGEVEKTLKAITAALTDV